MGYSRTYAGLLGVQKIEGKAFIVVAEEVEQVGSTGMSAVHEIKKAAWVPLAP